jgi:hypothetical protein
MAINVSFNGATIYKPGAYSKINIDLSGGFALGPVGLIAIFGEATRGRPGSEETDVARNVFTANQIGEVREKYGTGPVVDAMNFLFSPATDGAIPGGAQAVYVYKTNSSTRADIDLANSYGTVRSLEFGIGGNTITYEASETEEVAPVVAGSAIGVGAANAGATFDIAVDGVVETITLAAGTYADTDAVIVALGAIAGVTVSNDAEAIVLTANADANAAQNGYGRSIELIETNAGDLALLGHVVGSTKSSVESAMTITVNQTRDLLVEQETVGGNIVLEGGYDGVETTASVQISATQVILTAGATVINFDKSAYSTLLQLVNAMNLTADWSFQLTATLYNSLPASVLDQVTVGAKSSDAATIKPVRIKKDAQEVAELFVDSSIVDLVDQVSAGLMSAEAEVALAGGTLGGTSTAAITEALATFEEIRVNSVIPLFSRDASADILDSLTDATSAYSILGIHQAVKTHCNLMSTTKNRSERQGYLSFKDTWDASLDRASLLADQRLQMCIQDTRNIDSQGAIKWFQPWSQSCLVAGARAGSPVGTPMTFKFFNCTGIRHTEQGMSTPEADIQVDFNPNAQYEQAIQGGVTFFEAPQSGGIRCVVDNTTYQKDGNWVYNRGNVMYAADVLAFDFRNQLENIYVGQKNTIRASEVKSVAASILDTFLAQGITVATDEAPNGYKTLDVQINGNVIRINAIVVLVEGIDFILNDITITRVESEA